MSSYIKEWLDVHELEVVNDFIIHKEQEWNDYLKENFSDKASEYFDRQDEPYIDYDIEESELNDIRWDWATSHKDYWSFAEDQCNNSRIDY